MRRADEKLALLSLMVSSLLLVSCSHKEPSVTVTSLQKHHWSCDTGVVIDWIFEDATAAKMQFRLDDSKKLYILDRIYATDKGTLYSNGELAFRVKGQTGSVFWASNDEVIGKNCVGN